MNIFRISEWNWIRLAPIVLWSTLFFACALGATNVASAQPIENKSYCANGGRVVIFFVDITTPYDQTDKEAIVRATDGILSSFRGGEKLIIRTIADSHTHSERLIERCIPYCAANGALDKLFNCSDGAIRTDLERVRADVISSLKSRLAHFEELKHSDIVRTIFSVANDEAKTGQELVINIYSDLIENSDYFPRRYLFTFPLVRLIHGLKHQFKLIANLSGAEIHISGVGRSDSKDRRPLTVSELNKLREFWQAYFKECGARTITISNN